MERVDPTVIGGALNEQTRPDEIGLVTSVLVNRELGYQNALQFPRDYATRARSAGDSNYCCHRQVRCSSGQLYP